MTSIVQTMQEFCRHKDFRQTHIVLAFSVRAVMHCLKTGEIALRVNNRTFLRVVFMKLSVQFSIPSFFITIAPPDNRRMIHVTFYHAFNQTYSGGRIIFAMPASQFIHHIKSERITSFQKFRVSRIVAQTDRIHIHVFH